MLFLLLGLVFVSSLLSFSFLFVVIAIVVLVVWLFGFTFFYFLQAKNVPGGIQMDQGPNGQDGGVYCTRRESHAYL